MRYLLFLLPFCFPAQASAVEHCEVVGKTGATVYTYCPASMSFQDIATVVKSYSDIHFDKRMNQVHIHVFDSKKDTPKDSNKFMKMSDAAVEKHQVGIYARNMNTGHLSYLCRKQPKKQLEDCKELVK